MSGEQPGRYQRSFSGMVGAMVVLLVIVGVFVAFRELIREEPQSPVQPVDYVQPASFARGEADFDLLAPARLPEGWIATTVRFRNGEEQSWHLGTLTDTDRYVGLEQAPRPVDAMVEDHVGEDAVPAGDVSIQGQRWQSWTDSDDDLALVRETSEVTTLVVGRVSRETLEEFIATLR